MSDGCGSVHKVQYYETDQMGVAHHSNYIRWFEEARVDWMDQLGLRYADIWRCAANTSAACALVSACASRPL